MTVLLYLQHLAYDKIKVGINTGFRRKTMGSKGRKNVKKPKKAKK